MPQTRTVHDGATAQQTSTASNKATPSQKEHEEHAKDVQNTAPLEHSRWSKNSQARNGTVSQVDGPQPPTTTEPKPTTHKRLVLGRMRTVVKDESSPEGTERTLSTALPHGDSTTGPLESSMWGKGGPAPAKNHKAQDHYTSTYPIPGKTVEKTKPAVARRNKLVKGAKPVAITQSEEVDKVKPKSSKGRIPVGESKPVLLDADFVRANRSYPTREDYPDAPKDLFGDGHELSQLFLRFTAPDQIKTSFLHLAPAKRSKKSSQQDGKWSCALKVNVPGIGTKETTGEGITKKTAKNSSWVHLVSVLHESGELSQLLQSVKSTTSSATNTLIEPRLAKVESDAIVEIYNYAARYALVPDYKVSLVGRQKHRSSVQVRITLPEWHVEAVGQSSDITIAEASAVLDFKAQAELFHKHHETLPVENFIVTTQNAKQFLDLCRLHYPSIKFTIENEPVELKGTRWKAQMYLNGTAIGQEIPRRLKDQALELVNLTAALYLAHQEPELLETFAQIHRGERGSALSLMRPINAPIEYHSELVMMDSLRTLVKSGLPEEKETLTPEAGHDTQHFRRKRRLDGPSLQRRNVELAKKLAALREDKAGMESQAKLPMNSYRTGVSEMVSKNLYSIVVGATGSGKTTQVPRILLDEAIDKGVGAHCNIICTQPRRIAATSVARRVAAERGEQVGESVGYHVRFDSRQPRSGGSILYCTTGILLEQLKHSPEEVMDNASHIIVDEVHERDMLIDFLMINMRNIVQTRQKLGKSVPRIVLMSATLDTQLFANYFGSTDLSGSRVPCPSISVPGRTFPVQEYFLGDIMQDVQRTYGSRLNEMLRPTKGGKGDSAMTNYLNDEWAADASIKAADTSQSSAPGAIIDWKNGPADDTEQPAEDATSEQRESFVPLELVAATVGHICKTTEEGAILVFLPGLEEITKTNSTLLERPIYGCNFGDPDRFRIHMLHSTIPHEAQQEVFTAVPAGCRKVILSTNIAETSVTIPDVRYVVDTGKLRETRYDQVKRITRLQTVWASKSNVRQRAGRAGRVQDGHYFGLFSKGRHESLSAAGLPELLRSDLQETCLAVKAQRFAEPVQEFLAQAIEPPSPAAVKAAVAELKSLEAFTSDEQLTDLGRILSKMPVHPSLGKMIIFGIIFRCLDPILLIGAASEERSIFARPMGERVQANDARKSYSGYGSDQISFLAAFNELRQTRDTGGTNALWTRARAKYLHVGAFNTIERCAQQIESVLAEAGLTPRSRHSHRSANLDGIGGADLNVNSGNHALIRALLVAGLHPNLVTKPSSSGTTFRAPTEHSVFMHPSSLNSPRKGSPFPSGTLFAYSSLAKSPDGKTLFFRESTKVTPLVAMLFGGHLRLDGNVLTMDDWLPFNVRSDDAYQTAKLVLEYRKALDRLLRTAFRSLTQHREDPSQPFLAEIPMIDRAARDVAELLELENELKRFSGQTQRY